ncbi:thylakoid membrane protein TERC, chloroplastic-like isoform X2 [Malus domestica]|uniref:thylakoid membrane protein TERC, chloroplastic-like isoform X2 n=1 Tax=Malus domestica TaxID=3750 RepID=UPI0010AB2C77|nr:thylakoid membrane protein TERC, chloroplastic-like isoform X3 [Malus domestica]
MMGTASVIHNGVHIHLKLNSRLPRLSSPYPSPNWSRPHFVHNHIVSVRTEEKRGDSASCDGISNVEISHDDSPEKIKGREAYAASAKTVALWVCAAVAFGIGVGFKDGVGKATEFISGIGYFHMVLPEQWSFVSPTTLERFEVVNLFLASVLLYSSIKLFSSEEDDTDLSNNFIVKTCQRFIPVTSTYDVNRFFTFQDGVRKATPLLLTVAVIELSDVAFAVDSIPAVFGVTRDPFIVSSSNLFAIVGLRSLYRLISEGMSDLEYLQPSIAVVLSFIGCKLILDFFWVPRIDRGVSWLCSYKYK